MGTDPESQQYALKLRLYRAYLEALRAIPRGGSFMPYDWQNLPEKMNIIWMAYGQMLSEFSGELANIINALTHHVHRLRAWASVLAPLSNDEKMEATHEFIDVLGTAALGLPYAIKSRFAYAAAHLCHQANMAKDFAGWKDTFPDQRVLYLNDIEPMCAGWRQFRSFKRRVEAVGGNVFKDATNDFRNAYNHRFSSRFVLGMTGFVSRSVDEPTGEVGYGFGGDDPLDLTVIADLLAIERDRSYAAFEAFQALIREHEQAIAGFEADNPP